MALTQGQIKDKSWLGKFVATHSIGYIDLIEYLPNVYKDCCKVPGEYEETSSYSIFVDGNSTSNSARSFEGALASAMAYKHEGPNSSAGYYFVRMLGISEDK